VPRPPSRTAPTVVIPGWNGSGDGHWQTWLEAQLAAAGRQSRRPAFADLDRPDLGDWLTSLRETVADLPPEGYDVVAHSLGAVLWLHHAAAPGKSPRAARVVLVAPPSPRTDIEEIAAFFPPPMDVDTVRQAADGTVLVAGDNDPYIPEGIAAAYGLPLKMATTIVAGGGHMNVESAYGQWPAMLEWCNRDHLAFY
jgi:predicted alpha/beta hydrolase family esterase